MLMVLKEGTNLVNITRSVQNTYRYYNLDSGTRVQSSTRQASPTSLSSLHVRARTVYLVRSIIVSYLFILPKEW